MYIGGFITLVGFLLLGSVYMTMVMQRQFLQLQAQIGSVYMHVGDSAQKR